MWSHCPQLQWAVLAGFRHRGLRSNRDGAPASAEPTDMMAEEVLKQAADRTRSVNHKLQLYGALAGLKRGKLPTTDQLDVILYKAQQALVRGTQQVNLSSDTTEVVKTLDDVITASRELLVSKNEGDTLQKLLWDLGHTKAMTGEIQALSVPVGMNTVMIDGKDFYEGIRTLGCLLVTNGQFRKLLHDSLLLLRDIAGDAAQHFADQVRPTPAEIKEASQPAPDDVWHEEPQARFAMRRTMRSKKTKERSFFRWGRRSGSSTKGNVDTGDDTILKRARDKALAQNTREMLARKVSKEAREQMILRAKKMIVEIQGHPDYEKAVGALMSVTGQYASYVRDAAAGGSAATENVTKNSGVRIAAKNLRVIIEKFANCTSMDDMFIAIKEFMNCANHDDELRNWFISVGSFVKGCLLDHGRVLEKSAGETWTKLFDDARYLFGCRYNNQLQRVVQEAKFMLVQFEEDQLNNNFAETLKSLYLDLTNNSTKYFSLKKTILEDFKKVVVPALSRRIRYIPVPRIEISTPVYDVVVENIVIESPDFFPNTIEVQWSNRFTWGRKQPNQRESKVVITITGLKAHCNGVSYYVRQRGATVEKKSSTRFHDSGFLDINLGKDGMQMKIYGDVKPKNEEHFFRTRKVVVRAKGLKVDINSTGHKWFAGFIKHAMTMSIRGNVERFLEGKVLHALKKADACLYSIHRDAKRSAMASRDKSSEETPVNMYPLYLNSLRKQVSLYRAKRKDGVKKRRRRLRRFRVIFATERSKLQHVKSSDLQLRQADVYFDQVKHAEDWHCPVFDLEMGPGKRTSPKPQSVVRKPVHSRGAVTLTAVEFLQRTEPRTEDDVIVAESSGLAPLPYAQGGRYDSAIDLTFGGDLDLTLPARTTPRRTEPPAETARPREHRERTASPNKDAGHVKFRGSE